MVAKIYVRMKEAGRLSTALMCSLAGQVFMHIGYTR